MGRSDRGVVLYAAASIQGWLLQTVRRCLLLVDGANRGDPCAWSGGSPAGACDVLELFARSHGVRDLLLCAAHRAEEARSTAIGAGEVPVPRFRLVSDSAVRWSAYVLAGGGKVGWPVSFGQPTKPQGFCSLSHFLYLIELVSYETSRY